MVSASALQSVGSEIDQADHETQMDDSTAKDALLLSQEYKQVKEFANNRLHHKNHRKLFRPQSGMTYSREMLKQSKRGRNDNLRKSTT